MGIFIVFLFWTLDKIIYPEHAAGVFSEFYGLESMGDNIFLAIGIVQLIITLSFAAGLFKTWTYGLVLLLHTVSTVSTFSLDKKGLPAHIEAITDNHK